MRVTVQPSEAGQCQRPCRERASVPFRVPSTYASLRCNETPRRTFPTIRGHSAEVLPMRLFMAGWFFLLALSSAAARAEANWPQFRGPDGQGHSNAVGVPLRWSEEENIVWKTPIVGRGWSSPVVQDGKIWLTTAIEQPATPEERQRGLASVPKTGQYEVVGSVEMFAICVDAKTGRILHQLKLTESDDPEPIHPLNSFASPTPLVEAGRVYCHFGAYGTFCIDTTSRQVLWRRQLRIRHYVGPGSSPVLYKNLLIIPCDGADLQYIAALDKNTGQTVWQRDRPPLRTENPDFKKSYSTPLIIRVAGRDQCVIPGAQWVVSYNPISGEPLWRVDHGNGFSLAPRPVYDGRHVFICTGFGGTSLLAIRPDGVGDVTATHVSWRQSKQVPRRPSPIVVEGRALTVSDMGIVTCYDAATGKPLWHKRMPGNFSASPLAVDGRIYFSNQDGRTTVIAPGDTYQELAQNELDGQIMASLIVVDDDLLLRTDTHLYRISE